MTDPIVAETQQTFLEYRASFDEPLVAYWFGGKQGELVGALYKALGLWKLGLENVTWSREPKNASEIQLSFGVPSLMAGIQVGLGCVTMTAFNPDWSRSPQVAAVFQTALHTLLKSTGRTLESQLVTLGVHIKPGAKPFKDIVSTFVNAGELGATDATMYGVSVYSNDYSFVIDSSAVVAGGLFIKLIRNFAAEKTFEEMALVLYEDEEKVLSRLKLQLR